MINHDGHQGVVEDAVMCLHVPVLIWEDLLTVFTLVDRLIAVLALLFEVLSQCVEDGAPAGARILLVPPQLKRRGEELITIFTAVHLLVYTHTQTYSHQTNQLAETHNINTHLI